MKYNVEQYIAPKGKLLVKPFKYRTRTVETFEHYEDEEAKQKNMERDPLKSDEPELPIDKVRKVKSKAPYEIQLAEVVSSGDIEQYPVGTVVVYSIKFVKEFDLFKNTFLINNYDVHGVYTMD